jgi:magnesium transporter
MTVADALTQLRQIKNEELRYLFLLSDEQILLGQVAIQRMALAEGSQTLDSLSTPLVAVVQALDPKSEIIEKLEKFKIELLPVIDGNDHFIGIIRGKNILSVLKQDMVCGEETPALVTDQPADRFSRRRRGWHVRIDNSAVHRARDSAAHRGGTVG